MVEVVNPLHDVSQGEVPRQQHVRPLQSNNEEASGRPGADTRHLSQRGFDLLVAHLGEGLIAEAAVCEAFGEGVQREALALGKAARPKNARICRQEFRRRGQVTIELLREPREDGARRSDRELLASYLEDECAKGIEFREFVYPGTRPEVGVRVDHPGEDRIRRSEEFACAPVRNRVRRHVRAKRSVSTIWTTSATVSSRAQSRWSSQASATQLIGWPPAWITRSSPARCPSSEVPPTAST